MVPADSTIFVPSQSAGTSEENFKDIADIAPILIWVSDTAKQCSWFNSTWLKFTGRTMALELGNGWTEGVHADDLKRCLETYFSSFDARAPFSMEYRLRRHDGEYRWLLDKGVPRFAPNGEFAGFLGSCTDVTEQRRTQEKLESVIGSIADGIAVLDMNYRFTYCNEQGARMAGMVPTQLVGEEVWELFPHARDTRFFEEFQQALQSGQPVHFEEYYPEPLNIWLECRCFPGEQGLSVYFHDITERKRTEAALRESEERFHLLADAMSQLCWMARPDGHIYWYNQRWYDYTGTSLEQMAGWGWQSVHDPVALPEVLERWKASIASGEPFDMTFPLRGADGVFRPFLTRVLPQKDADGMVKQWFGTNTDVGELKSAENRFRTTFENAAVGIAHVAPDGRWLRINEVICRLTGYEREELLTKTFQDITHPDDLAADLAHVKRLLAGDSDSYTMEKRYIRKDQSIVWVNLTVSCARAPLGGVEYFIAVVENITERKAQQAALEKSEDRLRRLFESNVVGMIRWNLDSSLILDANQEFFRMTGYTREDVKSGHVDFRDLTPLEWKARNEEGIRAIREQGFAAPYEKEYFRKDGSRVALIIAGTRFEDSSSEGVSFLIDISDRKQQQQEIQDLNIRLKRSVAESHHRIKNNLQVLSAMIEMQSSQPGDSLPKERWTRLSTHIRTLASLHDILTLESKGGDDLDTISLSVALDRLLPILKAAMGGRRIVSDVDPEIRLPLKQSGSFLLLVNELVSNAQKHGAGDIEVRLKRQKQIQEGRLQQAYLEVCDDGPGFPPDFDPALAANTGLELIESLGVWDLGGEVRYENRNEGGARVVAIFPLSLM